MPPARWLNRPAWAKPYAMAIDPIAVTIHDRSEIAPTCAMLVGSMMMPEPIMLTAVSTVSCTTFIFFVVLAISVPLSIDSRGGETRAEQSRLEAAPTVPASSPHAQYVIGAIDLFGAFGHVAEAGELLLPALQPLDVADVG